VNETITFEQVGMILGLAAARDQRTTGDADALAWHADLNAAGINYSTAADALTRFYVDQAAIPADKRYRATTPDVIAISRKIRAERLEGFVYEPPPGDSDPHYLERLKEQRAAVADGLRPAVPPQAAIEGPPPASLSRMLTGLGRSVPDVDDEIAAVKRPGPLGIECPKCRAPIGRPCRLPGGRERPAHPARTTAAGGEVVELDREQQQEIERRRAISRSAVEPGTVIEPNDGFQHGEAS
jgi:hypothetical protein